MNEPETNWGCIGGIIFIVLIWASIVGIYFAIQSL